MHFYTSVTTNYIPKARILAKSVKKHCPGAKFHLVLIDKIPDGFNLENEPFDNLITLEQLELPVPNLKIWVFMHNITEICTAVKGQAILKIFKYPDADKVIYLDPDIAVLHNLDELEQLLDAHSVIITPHQLVPENDWVAIKDNEKLFLRRGIYNLGFLAVQRNKKGIEFAEWWRNRLVDYCFIDEANGLFVDQKWIDLAVALFEDIHILREKTYNIATWNLTHREVVTKNVNGVDKLFVDDVPVKFYHFSGIDSGAQESVLRKYGSHMPGLWKLRGWYLNQQELEGQNELGKVDWIYDYFSNGEKITNQQRVILHIRNDVYDYFLKTDPFIVTDQYYCFYNWFKEQESSLIDSKFNDLSKDELVKQVEYYKNELRLLESSESWRYTKPFREIGVFIRSLNKKVSQSSLLFFQKKK